jgi:hypothetical protein
MVLLQVPSARTKYVLVEAGVTVMLLPVPTAVPPQLPLYHFHDAPVPSVPPLTLNEVLWPTQTAVDVAVTDTVGTDVSLTVTTTFLHMVLLQVPSARTK